MEINDSTGRLRARKGRSSGDPVATSAVRQQGEARIAQNRAVLPQKPGTAAEARRRALRPRRPLPSRSAV